MWLYPQETANLVAFTEAILNGQLHFLCSVTNSTSIISCNNFFSCATRTKATKTGIRERERDRERERERERESGSNNCFKKKLATGGNMKITAEKSVQLGCLKVADQLGLLSCI